MTKRARIKPYAKPEPITLADLAEFLNSFPEDSQIRIFQDGSGHVELDGFNAFQWRNGGWESLARAIREWRAGGSL